MNCPNCNKKMAVKDSRSMNQKTYRRYSCPCGVMFYTEEKITQNAKYKLSKSYAKIYDRNR